MSKAKHPFIYKVKFNDMNITVRFKVGFVNHTAALYEPYYATITIYTLCHPSRFESLLVHEVAHAIAANYHFQYWFLQVTSKNVSVDDMLVLIDESHSCGAEDAIAFKHNHQKTITLLNNDYRKFFKTIATPAMKKYFETHPQEEVDRVVNLMNGYRVLSDRKRLFANVVK